MTSSSSVKAGLQLAGTSTLEIIQFFVNWVVIPVIAAVVVFFLLMTIAAAAKKHKMGEEYQDDIIRIVIQIVILALVLSFYAWGWTMIGQNPGGAPPSSSQTSSTT